MRSDDWILKDVSVDLGISGIVGHTFLHLVHPGYEATGPVVDVLTLHGDVADDVHGVVADVLQLVDDVTQDDDAGVRQGVPGAMVSVKGLGQLHRGHQSLREGHFAMLNKYTNTVDS